MDSDPKYEDILVQIFQELSIQDSGSSTASILTEMFVHFAINLNIIAQPPPNKHSSEKCPQTTVLCPGFLSVLLLHILLFS